MRKEVCISKVIYIGYNHSHNCPILYFCDEYSKYYKFDYWHNMLGCSNKMRLVYSKIWKGYRLYMKNKKGLWKLYSAYPTQIVPCDMSELMEKLL